LEMPGDTAICRKWILDALKDGSLPMEDMDKACRNILKWIDRYVQPAETAPVDWDAHHDLAGEIAADCAVLMKNDGVLPLTGKEKLHITGELFETMRYQGAGSSMIHPTRVTTVRDAFEKRNIKNHDLQSCDTILVFAGLTDENESEGCDRETMRLPEKQLKLIDEMIATGRKVVVVLFGGSVVELPFNDQVSAILNMFLPGQNGGEATALLLLGEKNPSGRLAETWPMRYEDVPGHESFGKTLQEVYAEGTDVGYRYYQKQGIPVRYPFGHGLSYTTFNHSEWHQKGNTCTQTITNTGGRFGGEVAQLYLDGELKGFAKVYLEPGESKTVMVTVEEDTRTVYPDTYTVPALPKSFPITMESRFTGLQQSMMGRILFNAVLSVARSQMKKAEKMPDGPEKENARKGALFLRRILESNSLRSMSMSAGQSMPWHVARGMMEMTNGHLIRGIRCFLSPVKAPTLPKEENAQ
ncbi:MAG: glycoside hydrolase family 3 C-terminal domain-containing protein, partial [Clostridia bacterium]|nr:glycoside hydrolase family 3 C-terminal domain-containing protein [Clostridia bacterium]